VKCSSTTPLTCRMAWPKSYHFLLVKFCQKEKFKFKKIEMKWFLKFSIAKSEGENTNFFRDTFFLGIIVIIAMNKNLLKTLGPNQPNLSHIYHTYIRGKK